MAFDICEAQGKAEGEEKHERGKHEQRGMFHYELLDTHSSVHREQ